VSTKVSPGPFDMPEYVIQRVMRKRGRLRVFDHFEPSKTAFVVIDMQKFYLADVAPALAIIPNINRLANIVRERGGVVAWVKMTAGENGKSLWPLYHDYFFTKEAGERHRDNLTEGAPGHALHEDLDVRPQDIHATKKRFTAFIPSVSDLPEKLAARGIKNVLIGGTVTNFCCETSARDAMMLDYRVVMVSDANAARHEEDHSAGFTSLYQSFGDVLTIDEIARDLLVAKA
jgi:ureidoacrylate peracid hydrolase